MSTYETILYYVFDNIGLVMVLGAMIFFGIYGMISVIKDIVKTKEEQRQKEYWNNVFELTDLKRE